MRWGLVPYWAKDLKIGFSTINAMAETVDTKSTFRAAFERCRCLVPVDNFYEWQKTGPKDYVWDPAQRPAGAEAEKIEVKVA